MVSYLRYKFTPGAHRYRDLEKPLGNEGGLEKLTNLVSGITQPLTMESPLDMLFVARIIAGF